MIVSCLLSEIVTQLHIQDRNRKPTLLIEKIIGQICDSGEVENEMHFYPTEVYLNGHDDIELK